MSDIKTSAKPIIKSSNCVWPPIYGF